MVIGAGGHRCPVAQALGEVSEREEVVVAQESETRLPPEWVGRLAPFMHAPELYVEPDLRGYGWYFPKRDFINIGVGCTQGGRRQPAPAARRADGEPARLGPAAGRHAASSRSRGTRTWCGGRRRGAWPARASA